MGENSAIEWTDHTFNPWSGCTRVSPGCANCYAESMAQRFPALGNWGPGAERKRTSEANWRKPLSWNRAARALATTTSAYTDRTTWRPRVFCASLADWLDPEVPAEWLADLLALIAQTPHLDWMLLTKRPELWRARLAAAEASKPNDVISSPYGMVTRWRWSSPAWSPSNVWVGTSVEDQRRADERIPALLEIPARVRFLSCEPLLGPVILDAVPCDPLRGVPRVDWVIAGGESGPGARPMHPAWARSLRDQCQEAGVPFFFKQWGEHAPAGAGCRAGGSSSPGAPLMQRVGKKAAGRLLDGRTWDEVPSS